MGLGGEGGEGGDVSGSRDSGCVFYVDRLRWPFGLYASFASYSPKDLRLALGAGLRPWCLDQCERKGGAREMYGGGDGWAQT